MKIILFVSHSASNPEVVKALVDLLMGTMAITDREIRCTSLPTNRLPTGAHTSTKLRQDLNEAQAVIGLMTKESVGAPWVHFELGAAWVLGKRIFPILLGAEFADLPGPLREHNAIKAQSADDMLGIIEEICDVIGCKKQSTPRVQQAVRQFIVSLESIVARELREGSVTEETDEDSEELTRLKAILEICDRDQLRSILERYEVKVPRSQHARKECAEALIVRLADDRESEEILNELFSRDELKNFCESLNLHVSGTKAQLIERLLYYDWQ